jgi:hypothetical protein
MAMFLKTAAIVLNAGGCYAVLFLILQYRTYGVVGGIRLYMSYGVSLSGKFCEEIQKLRAHVARLYLADNI